MCSDSVKYLKYFEFSGKRLTENFEPFVELLVKHLTPNYVQPLLKTEIEIFLQICANCKKIGKLAGPVWPTPSLHTSASVTIK